MKKVVQLYQGVLPAMGLTVGNNDQLFIGGGELGNAAPMMIETLNVYLPTDEFIKNSDLRDQIAFHPLAEDTLKKRSPMLTAIQNAFTCRLYSAGVVLIEALINACIMQRNGKEISNPRLLSFISGNEDIDEKSKIFFKKLTQVMETDQSKKLFQVYLKHCNEATDGVSRQCSIGSPLVKELERIAGIGSAKPGGLTVWGVESPRKKDVLLLAEMIKSLFPGIENEAYSKGSVDRIAPYTDAILHALLPINQDISEAAKALAAVEPVTSLIEYLCVDLTPVEEFISLTEDYDIFRNSVIKTAYNDGDGWNTAIRNPNDGGTLKEEIHRVPASQQRTNTTEENPVAITKKVILNAIKPIPGTRQPLVSNVAEEDYRTVSTKPRQPGNRNVTSRGYDRESSRSGYSSSTRYRASSFRTSREVIDEMRDVEAEIRRAERDRRYDEVDAMEDDLKDLKGILRDIEDEEDRDRGGRRGYSRDRDDRGDRGRPRPRAVSNNRDRDRDSRGGEDRFGRRRR